MNILTHYVLPTVPVVLVIAFLVLARLTRHRPFVLSRYLMLNSLMACCFAGPFVRVGADKALVAFGMIFVITSLFSVARWAEHRHYQSTRLPQDHSQKVQP